MHIVVAHNLYQQPGGEDAVFNAECELLEQSGHQVTRFTCTNADTASYSALALAASTLWNQTQYQRVRTLLRAERPDILHVHNTLPLISPAIFYAAEAEGVPVVQMLHNYRPFCLNGVLYRDMHVCEDCIGRFPLPGVVHKCYRDSRGASAAILALFVLHHKLLRTYEEHVSLSITSTQFAKNLFVRMGLDGDKIVVKPNLVNIAKRDAQTPPFQNSMKPVFVGRLDNRKGVSTLLAAIEKTKTPLVLVGDGVLRPVVERWIAEHPELSVEITGWLNVNELSERFEGASMLILPSEFYESFGNVIVEAFSHGVPVITTDIGAQAELVVHQQNGLVFPVGDASALAHCIQLLQNDNDLRGRLGRNARMEYEEKYTPERNYEILMQIYSQALHLNGKDTNGSYP